MGQVITRAGIVCLILVQLVTARPFGALHDVSGLPENEIAKIRTVNEAYASAWLKNDQEAVLRNFSQDAVLIPQGHRPVRGMDAIKKFWWPPDGPRTVIRSFTITTDEIDGDNCVAYVRGTFEFSFSFEDKGRTTNLANAGNYMMIMKRQPDGNWLISHRMWGDLPR